MRPFSLTEASARYLEQLANQLTAADLDEGFSLPAEYKQFDEADGKWPANKRPL